MQQVKNSRKFRNGIQVSSAYAGDIVDDFFTLEDLLDQQIDARDLLTNPRSYRVDTIQHTIEAAGKNPGGK